MILFLVGNRKSRVNQANVNEKVWILRVSPEMLRFSETSLLASLRSDAEERESSPGRGKERTVWKGWKRPFSVAFS